MKTNTILLEYEDTMIYKKLNEILGKNSPYLALIGPMICENEKAVNTFIKIAAGMELPDIIPNGTLVHIDLDTVEYNSTFSKDDILKYNTPENDKIICSIQQFNGFHKYSAYTIQFKGPDDTLNTANLSSKDLHKFVGI
jgi:hypothetical protein|tara:strand:- start:3926 stop:4342 length:417 start_codon:yes stop_codon:yes gene_type:complete